MTRYNARRQDLPRQIEVAELPSVADVVRGLDNGEFEAYYQPKVALDGGGLIGAEVRHAGTTRISAYCRRRISSM